MKGFFGRSGSSVSGCSESLDLKVFKIKLEMGVMKPGLFFFSFFL